MARRYSDEELVSSYVETRQNDFFEQLYDRYCHKVHRKCLSFTRDQVQAEDLTQDIFLKLVTKLDSFKYQARFSTWLYSITYNYCADQTRVRNRRDEFTVGNDWELIGPVQEENSTEQLEQSAQHLKQAMEMLSREERQLLMMKYQQEVSIKELADQNGLTESAVKMRLKRSRDRLRQFYWQVAAV